MVFDKLSNAKISNGPEIRGRKEPLMARGGKREGGGRRMGAPNERSAHSDLNDLIALRQQELPYRMHKPVDDRLFRGDVDVLETAGGENFFRDGCAFAQDVLRAPVIGQCRIERALQTLRRHVFLR